MKFHIITEEKPSVVKKIDNMFKLLTEKPTVTFSEPMWKKVHQYVGCSEDGYKKFSYRVNVIEVEISDIVDEEWVFVASVFHRNNFMSKVSDTYYGMIPERYGVNWNLCEYCGRTHKNVVQSHIIYNKVTGEWKQVGSACIKKMFAKGKYLSSVMVDFYKFLTTYRCDEDILEREFRANDSKSQYFKRCVEIRDLIPAIDEYRKVSPEWVRGESKDKIFDMFMKNDFTRNEERNDSIFKFIDEMETYSDFIQDIKTEFKSGYVNLSNAVLIFFGVKMYDDQPKRERFDDILNEHNIQRGEKMHVRGKILKHEVVYDEYYGDYTNTYIRDEQTDLTIITSSSSIYKFIVDKDVNLCDFICTVKGWSSAKQYIYAKGRLSKTPKIKYV